MKACGLIVEYNPFHNGHVYHVEQSKEKTNADVMIAVMSSSFLQRGEPAIIDKFHRTKAALNHGVDLVVELPFAFAVQYADLFARGAILTLTELNVDYVCFGSEAGKIEPFTDGYDHYQNYKSEFTKELHDQLNQGLSFPQASKKAYQTIDLASGEIDLGQPNNILGFSYVKAIKELASPVKPATIKRTKSGYHDETIEHEIASATSIRKEIIKDRIISNSATKALPTQTIQQLEQYLNVTSNWHDWELYFPYLQLLVQIKSHEELRQIQGVIEGLEYRLKQTVQQANDFHHWMTLLKTKRYTWTRLQRMFVHLLTNTTKETLDKFSQMEQAPYTRILGMNSKGREYVQTIKKDMNAPLISNIQELNHPMLSLEEKATDAYYIPHSPKIKQQLKRQELTGPIII